MFATDPGALKIGPDHNMVKVYNLRPVQSTHEVAAHYLEVAVFPVRMARLQSKAASTAQASFRSFFQTGGGATVAGSGYRGNILTSNQRNFQTFPGQQSNTTTTNFNTSNSCFPPPICPDTAKILAR